MLSLSQTSDENIKKNHKIEKVKEKSLIGAGIIIVKCVNEEIQFLLVSGKKYNLSVPKGCQESFDKNLKETAIRECYEESGITADMLIFVNDFYTEETKIKCNEKKIIKTNNYFLALLNPLYNDFKPILNSDEHIMIDYFILSDFKLGNNNRFCVERDSKIFSMSSDRYKLLCESEKIIKSNL